MKTLYLFGLLLMGFMHTHATDTLTYRRIYNFEVGDTFDYQTKTTCDIPYNEEYNYYFTRYIIEGKDTTTYPNNIFYTIRKINKWSNTLTSQLVSSPDSMLSTTSPSCSYNLMSYIGSFNGRIENNLSNILMCQYSYSYAEGLGETRVSYSYGDGLFHSYGKVTTLVYYSKGNEKYGTPYYKLTGEEMLGYTPVPEENAEWISENLYNKILLVREHITTLHKVKYAGKYYTPLSYTSYRYLSQHNTTDSLIGYFRNDTINKRVVFTDSLGKYENILYDFNLINGSAISNSCISLSKVAVNQDSLTCWSYINYKYLEGIGGLEGFVRVQHYGYDASNLPRYGKLICFNVNGQTVYPSYGSSCSGFTDVESLSDNGPSFSIAPIPSATSVTLLIPAELLNSTLTITDLTGRILLQQKLEAEETSVSINELPAGIYLATVVSPDGRSATQKLIKE